MTVVFNELETLVLYCISSHKNKFLFLEKGLKKKKIRELKI